MKAITIAAVSGLLWALSLSEVASPAEAQIVINVPSDQPTIQAAIDIANNGDTVLVAPGAYQENINFRGKAITVASTDGPEITIIDGNRADSVVTFATGEGRASVLSGFTLQNGRSGFDTLGFGNGGGIRIQNSSPMILGNVITMNLACVGAGIASSFGSPVVQGNTITGNVQAGCSGGIGGGGISIAGNSAAQILDNVIADNAMTSANGGGISLFAAGTPTISGNVIRGNVATGLIPCAQGGGISLVNQSDALIVQNLIISNRAGCGGGIFWLVPSGARGPFLVNNTVAGNDSAQGSAILADGFQTQTLLINNLVIGVTGQTALLCGSFAPNPPLLRSNDVFSDGGTAYGGTCDDPTGINGNISADPLFVDPLSSDYHLQAGSPAIDAGDNAAPGLPETDLDGNPRIVDGTGMGQAIIDMGVYEFSPAPSTILFWGQPAR